MKRILTFLAAGSALALTSVATVTSANAQCLNCGVPDPGYYRAYDYSGPYGYEGPGYAYGYVERGSPRHYGWKPGYPHYSADDYYNQHRQLQGTR